MPAPLPATRGSNRLRDLMAAADALRNLPLFERLGDEQFRQVASLLEYKTVARGDYLVMQAGPTDTNLYIVRAGRAVMRTVEDKYVDRSQQVFLPGSVLNQVSFLSGRRNMETLEALEELGVWFITRARFDQLLDANPGFQDSLVIPDDIQEIRKNVQLFDWQENGETVLFYSKKHPWVFWSRAFPVVLPLLLIGVMRLPSLYVWTEPLLFRPIAIVLLLISAAWALWQLVDWGNDFYAITDRRIIHREKVLFFSDELDQAPIGKIQDVTVQKFGLGAALFDVGDVRIETQGTHSNIIFAQIRNPAKVSKVIYEQQRRALGETLALDRSKIREALRHQMRDVLPRPADAPKPKPHNYEGFEPPEDAPVARSGGPSGPDPIQRAIGFILPSARTVDKMTDSIVYRRSILQLIRIAYPQVALLIFYLAVVAGLGFMSPEFRTLMLSVPLVFVVVAGAILCLGWLLWRYEDWRNDMYILTKDKLIDIDRTPFSIRVETRETSLSAVQNITSRTLGFFDTLFNVGDVVIKTGGTDGELIFARVSNPRQVLRDISERLEKTRAVASEKEAISRRKEFIEAIGIYDDLNLLHPRDPS